MKSLWRNRALMLAMVRRDIRSRYRGSVGEALWTVLHPLLLLATYYFVFGIVLGARKSLPSFLAGMLPWLAISEAVGRAPSAIVEHRTFVKKMVFPLEMLPANLVISGLVTELVALAIFVIALAGTGTYAGGSLLWLPIVLLAQVLLTAGMCWFLAAAGVFVRDLTHTIGFLLTLMFFLTPICYPESALPVLAAKILRWNPVWWIVAGYRAILLEGRAPEMRLLIPVGPIFAIAGHAWFQKLRASFPDVL